MATVVLGAQWGDEGKGKLVDILCPTAQLCLRAQGGDNAGHTIVANGVTYDFHILPSGLTNPKCLNLIGSGCVVNVPGFFKELDALKVNGLDTDGRIFISDRAHIVFDLHKKLDGLEEVELGAGLIGTTKKGIGPTYSTKMSRSGIRISDLKDLDDVAERLRRMAGNFKKRFGDLLEYDVEEEISRFKDYVPRLQPYITDIVPKIEEAKARKDTMLIEGANAIMLDIDHGTYPFVTSSNTGLGGVLTGTTIGWRSLREVIGVVKAYTTRVGSGPFPTEQLNEYGEKLQTVGREWGVTTGRKRRCGWLDLVVVKYSQAVNDYTSLNLTKLDILDDFDTIKVATEYSLNGKKLPSFPANIPELASVDVTYQEFPGWKQSIRGIKTYEELPENCRKYIEFIDDFVGVKCRWIGTGPERESMIER
ncbi:adenylosuccinate synthetase-like protein [Aulographum hederae CBS 113979]|uniref:Adenylosuccinate synthetase n=1 Tax=Aulographum hederae CBS 113979 TaxID=1176131 RepID=A0A6G1HB20_9PEZI|nr:adenylosuccinate synthetase-like protein [Aulographum hederae CBS 113979]